MTQTPSPEERTELDADIAGINLDPIGFLAVYTYRWPLEKVDEIELEYRCFLQCTRDYPEHEIAPSQDCDLYWHQHILSLQLYLEHCDQLFKRPLYHWPYAGLMGEQDAQKQQERFDKSQVLVRALLERVKAHRAARKEPAQAQVA